MTDNYTHHVPPPCDEAIEILHEDEDIIVVNKPAGLLSVPGRFVKDCVLSRLRQDYPDVVVIHRLDLDTSGLLIYGRSKAAISDLNRQFRERSVNKIYIAEVYGLIEDEKGRIDLPIAPDPINRPRQLIDHEKGKSALTKYTRISCGENTTRLQLVPITGRSHQLRIHLASIDHPILGCDLYAHEKALRGAERLMLHAQEIEFEHPVSGLPMHFINKAPF